MHNHIVGKDITVDQLFDQGFDAIFIGTGTSIPKTLDVPGANLPKVIQSSYYLHMLNLYNSESVGRHKVPLEDGENIVVIGAGNVAMDTARTATRMGANTVTVVYHRGIENMSALKTEYHEALEEGVKFKWQASTKEFLGEKNILKAIKIAGPEGEEIIKVDRILLAIGTKPANRIVSTSLQGIEVDDNGYVKTSNYPYGMTTRKGIFAGGDVVHTPQTVVLAMREAKEVAKGMAQYVDAVKLLNQ